MRICEVVPDMMWSTKLLCLALQVTSSFSLPAEIPPEEHPSRNGVRATDFVNSYPSALHVGASWDKNLTYQRGYYMGKEFKAKGVNVLLGPNVGPLGRTPLGGRNWEGFSVDPYLTGQLSAESIIGHQDAGVIANVKVSTPFTSITTTNLPSTSSPTSKKHSAVPTLALKQYPPTSTTRPSTNTTSGRSSTHKLMNGLLKTELEFEGFVLLDWNAQHNLESANAGLDMVMPMGGFWGENLTMAVENGTVKEARVTDMATRYFPLSTGWAVTNEGRILAAWYLVGQDIDFPTPGIGMKNLSLPHEQVEARIPESRPTLLEGAIAGHVLVKNENNTLPFAQKPKMISVFGYDATVAKTKNTDNLFQLGYTSSPEMGQAVLGTEEHFDQAAKGGTIVSGAAKDGSWVNWDLSSSNPDVNGATDVCLVFINAMATEGWDRDGLHDDFSDALILNVASQCANTVVTIHAAGIRLVDQWIEHPNITATIIAHLPGQDSGEALVKLLYGEADFSGKLPYTLAKNESDYTPYKPCGLEEGSKDPQCDFTEGVYLDYRSFDDRDVAPRFEFGYGLSYTEFEYSDLVVKVAETSASATDDDLWSTFATVQATVSNIGKRDGEEITQLYVAIPNSPPKQLRGFEKVKISQGESAEIPFELARRDLSVWDVVKQDWTLQSGNYTIFVGSSSRALPLTESFTIEV
uniref:beta-glucosidase n=1 Tax=Fusarium oxysporum (strain Fo5176) TaxID=660025 RepID=A0A0C4DII3_FUSOF